MLRQLTLLPLFETVELNEVGFKFVRKCINAVETKGKVPAMASGGAAVLARVAARGLELYCIFCGVVLLVKSQSLMSLTEERMSEEQKSCTVWNVVTPNSG